MARALAFALLVLATAVAVRPAAGACTLKAPSISAASLTSICAADATYGSPACSVWRLCNDETLSPPIFPQLCNTTRVAATLCLDDADVVATVPACSRSASGIHTALEG